VRFNLKYNYPVILMACAFGLAVYLSFRHDSRTEPADDRVTSTAVVQDQVVTSSSQTRPVPPAGSQAGTLDAQISPAALVADRADVRQIQILDKVLASKNDNDPRLDRELRELSPAAKRLARSRYASLSPEKRNQRGTIVFLIGRDMNSTDDLSFLHQVLNEPPCRSLTNCEREETGSVTGADRHHEGMNEVSLAYPQLAALKMIEAYLNSPDHKAELLPTSLAELEAARRSPVHAVASMAEDLSRQYHATHP
jgi:hypothetical protein